MVTIKQVEEKTMTPEKKKAAKQDYFAFYVGRPLSYLFTIPFVHSKITPNTFSILSIFPSIIGFALFCFAKNVKMAIFAWLLFFVWNILDGIDGNLARYRQQFSSNGSVLDAMSGYVAMVLFFFGAGVVSDTQSLNTLIGLAIPSNFYTILGGLSGIFVIFPRLIMHKARNAGLHAEKIGVEDKANYGVLRLIALNLTSVSGFVQPILLLTIIFNVTSWFTVVYFVINAAVMVASLKLTLE